CEPRRQGRTALVSAIGFACVFEVDCRERQSRTRPPLSLSRSLIFVSSGNEYPVPVFVTDRAMTISSSPQEGQRASGLELIARMASLQCNDEMQCTTSVSRCCCFVVRRWRLIIPPYRVQGRRDSAKSGWPRKWREGRMTLFMNRRFSHAG